MPECLEYRGFDSKIKKNRKKLKFHSCLHSITIEWSYHLWINSIVLYWILCFILALTRFTIMSSNLPFVSISPYAAFLIVKLNIRLCSNNVKNLTNRSKYFQCSRLEYFQLLNVWKHSQTLHSSSKRFSARAIIHKVESATLLLLLVLKCPCSMP